MKHPINSSTKRGWPAISSVCRTSHIPPLKRNCPLLLSPNLWYKTPSNISHMKKMHPRSHQPSTAQPWLITKASLYGHPRSPIVHLSEKGSWGTKSIDMICMGRHAWEKCTHLFVETNSLWWDERFDIVSWKHLECLLFLSSSQEASKSK